MAQEKISSKARDIKPYVVKWQDETMRRRGLTPPLVASAEVTIPPGGWAFDSGEDFDDGLFFDP